MSKLTTSLLLTSFILWILPLGIFIKPSQEKFACDGQRAMCMCRVMMHKSSDKVITGIVLKVGTSTNKENSSGGASNYFMSAKQIIVPNLKSTLFFKNQKLYYINPCLNALEYVPKI